MTIYVDTRQKKNKHDLKHKQLINLGYTLEPKALKTGDYMLKGNDKISIDTKQDLQELSSNIFRDEGRFMREIRRAYESKMKFIVLIEQGGNIKTIDDVITWKPQYGKVPPRVLRDRMFKIHMAYGTEFLFCDKKNTGEYIAKLLSEGTKTDQQEVKK